MITFNPETAARLGMRSGAPTMGRMLRFDTEIADGRIQVGRWDRIATFGEGPDGVKVKGGDEVNFTPETFTAMIENWYKRGGPLPLCLDHSSALGGQVRAPAAAFYDAAAVIYRGQTVTLRKLAGSTAAPPNLVRLTEQAQKFATEVNPAPTPDGLWFYRSEVTPLGEHPTEGLRNYRGVSPFFIMDGTDEQERPIGPVIYDAAAVNVQFQAGCELTMGALSAPAAPEKTTMATEAEKAHADALETFRTEVERHGDSKSDASKIAMYNATFSVMQTERRLKESAAKSGNQATGASRAFSQGATMDPEQMKRFGFEPDDDDAKKAEKMAAYFAKCDEALAKMAAAPAVPPAAMAVVEPEKDKEEKEKEEKAMAALKMSLIARNVNVPTNASRAILMSLATIGATAPTPDVSALVQAEMKRIRDAEAATAETAERAALVTMARTAKAPEWEIAALNALPINLARDAATKYGQPAGAPAYLFGRVTKGGAPVGAPAEHYATAPKGPRVIKNGGIDVLISDDESAEAISQMAASKDPTIMGKIDAMLAPNERAQMWCRLSAAGKIAEKEQPHIFEAERTRAILMGQVG